MFLPGSMAVLFSTANFSKSGDMAQGVCFCYMFSYWFFVILIIGIQMDTYYICSWMCEMRIWVGRKCS